MSAPYESRHVARQTRRAVLAPEVRVPPNLAIAQKVVSLAAPESFENDDLRAPLRSIDGFSQVLLEDYTDKLDEQGKDYLNRVRSASQRMAQLIDDMLKLSRVTHSEMSR